MNKKDHTFTNKQIYELSVVILKIMFRKRLDVLKVVCNRIIDFLYNELDMEWTRIYALHADTKEEKLEQRDIVNKIALALVKRKSQSSPWGRKMKIEDSDPNQFSSSNNQNWFNYYVLVPKLSKDERDSLDDLGFETSHYSFASRLQRRKDYVKINKS